VLIPTPSTSSKWCLRCSYMHIAFYILHRLYTVLFILHIYFEDLVIYLLWNCVNIELRAFYFLHINIEFSFLAKLNWSCILTVSHWSSTYIWLLTPLLVTENHYCKIFLNIEWACFAQIESYPFIKLACCFRGITYCIITNSNIGLLQLIVNLTHLHGIPSIPNWAFKHILHGNWLILILYKRDLLVKLFEPNVCISSWTLGYKN